MLGKNLKTALILWLFNDLQAPTEGFFYQRK